MLNTHSNYSIHMKALWHSGKSSMTLLIFIKSGTIMVQRPVKWRNDKAKNKFIAMKLPSRKQMLQQFEESVYLLVERIPDSVQEKLPFHPSCTPY